MPVIIQTSFESAVTEAGKDTFVESYIEEKKTVTEFDMRNRDWEKILKADSKIYWSDNTYTVDVHEFSTFHCPVINYQSV